MVKGGGKVCCELKVRCFVSGVLDEAKGEV